MTVATFELVCILAAIGLFASAKSYQPVMLGGLGLLVIAWLMRLGVQRRTLRSTQLDGPLILFIVTGLISLWVSYDVWTSLAKFYLILGGISLYYVLNQTSTQIRLAMAGGLVLFAAVLALYFITQHNELAETGADKFLLLGATGAYLRRLSPQLNLYQPHPNVMAGVLEVATPIGLGLLLITRRALTSSTATPGKRGQGWRLYLAFATLAITLGIILFGLLLTGSRGAWFSLGVAGLGWALSAMQHTVRLRMVDTLAVVTILGCVLLLILRFRGSAELFMSERLAARLSLYRDVSQLLQDYFFTGAGLNTFPLLHGVYVVGIDVIQQNHPHNLYLAVWLEQGLLGLVALLWLGFAFLQAYRRWWQNSVSGVPLDHSQVQRLLTTASFWSMVVIFCHGLIDSVPYNSRFLPLIFIPLGLSGFLGYHAAGEPTRVFNLKLKPGRTWAVVGIILLSLLFWGRNLALSSWYANLGAVAQAKIELSDYYWPDRIPSKVRATADLNQPIRLFKQALAIMPGNVTANKRLEMIDLATNQQVLENNGKPCNYSPVCPSYSE